MSGSRDGIIAKVGRITPDATCTREIDASGLIVAPGFIDLHTHYDAQLFWDPYLTTSGWNGVTSVVIGNCGFGFAPVKKEHRERAMRSMTKVEAIPMATLETAMPWDWETYPEMLESIDRTPLAVNVLPYVGVNPLLIWVMGLRRRQGRPNAHRCASMPKWRDCSTRRWTRAPAAGRRSASALPASRRRPRATMPRSRTTTARRCRATSCTRKPAWCSPRSWASAAKVSSSFRAAAS